MTNEAYPPFTMPNAAIRVHVRGRANKRFSGSGDKIASDTNCGTDSGACDTSGKASHCSGICLRWLSTTQAATNAAKQGSASKAKACCQR